MALLHLEGRNAAQSGKALMEKVLTHQRVNQKPGKKHGEAQALGRDAEVTVGVLPGVEDF